MAGGLQKLGVTKGDRVIIYMPLIPEAVVAMLATVRLGAVHSVVFGGKLSQYFLLLFSGKMRALLFMPHSKFYLHFKLSFSLT